MGRGKTRKDKDGKDETYCDRGTYLVGLSIGDMGAILNGANLYQANLSWADLTSANLTWADLSGANLTRAELFRAMSTNDGGHYQAIPRSVRGGKTRRLRMKVDCPEPNSYLPSLQ